jgi:hypothetical protein
MFATDNRKRKQQDDKLLSSSMPNTSSWSDFINSSPSSPSVDSNNFNFDTFFEQHQLHIDHNNQSGSNSRRHSVAVGEMDYHSFDFSKQDINLMSASDNAPWADLHLLLNSTTGGHLQQQQQYPDRPIHRRTLSLREDDPHYATLLSPASSTSSQNFFSSSFLDALVAENGIGRDSNSDAATIISDMSFMDAASTTDLLSQSGDFLKLATGDFNNSTITPSAITNEIHTMADWLLEQQEVKEMHAQAQKRQRRSTDSLAPASPTHTMGSSLSSLSPSPPITPMQPASLGFEPISFQQAQPPQQQTQTNEWDISNHNLLNSTNNNKSGIISARILQGETTASSLKPLIQDYLIRRDHQDRSLPVTGERTVMVLTSRVAQKSYGTEKRYTIKRIAHLN